ncbi:hypothetical protein [Nocardia wallacei]|uniref:hypothetical protein n=1 Tax=Nocardia wallacei TaxID=480035 RepID=UPI0024573642|nr:hypothetical protein [Nocardia wallacei]
MKNSIDKYLRWTHRDAASARIRRLAARAERLGYILVRGQRSGAEWLLLDTDNREIVCAAAQLEEIEQRLDT